MGKTITGLIIEGKTSVLDSICKPYTILYDKQLDRRLTQAINILAVKRGYRVVNVSERWGGWTVSVS